MILHNGKQWKTLSDGFYHNGKKIVAVYRGGKKYYPDKHIAVWLDWDGSVLDEKRYDRPDALPETDKTPSFRQVPGYCPYIFVQWDVLEKTEKGVVFRPRGWYANAEYCLFDAGSLLGYSRGRTYTKAYDGCCAALWLRGPVAGWPRTTPVTVSTSLRSAANNYNNSSGYDQFDYLGLRWYVEVSYGWVSDVSYDTPLHVDSSSYSSWEDCLHGVVQIADIIVI